MPISDRDIHYSTILFVRGPSYGNDARDGEGEMPRTESPT
jgi:hypothetical protein